MKSFPTYQKLEGEPMSERDKQEVNSPFWNEGKFENYVKPFLKEPGTLVDMGCNSGLFLKLAEDMGFKSIGVDSDSGAIKRGEKWRKKVGGNYRLIESKMEKVIDELPIIDYTIFVNSAYYLTVNDFLNYLDKLRYKTRYCVIVTAEKKHINRCWAAADIETIRSYFRCWEEVGYIAPLPLEGAHARKMESICFKSGIELVPIDSLDSSNHVQDGFYTELEKGTHYTKTRYFRIIKPYRKKWSEEYLYNWFQERINIYNDIKLKGLQVPIIVNKNNLILDGNHRFAIVRELGFKNIYVRRV